MISRRLLAQTAIALATIGALVAVNGVGATRDSVDAAASASYRALLPMLSHDGE